MKISSWLKIGPIVFAIISVVTMAYMYGAVLNEREIIAKQNRLEQLAVELNNVTVYLTNLARAYLQYGEEIYYERYLHEINEIKTAERVLSELTYEGMTPEETELMQTAKKIYDEMIDIEELAFMEAHEMDFEAARELMYSGDYFIKEQFIRETLNRFQKEISARSEADAQVARNTSTAAIVLAMITCIGIMVMVYMSSLVINRKIKAIRDITKIASKISDGDFDVDLSKYKSNDEFGMLAQSTSVLVGTIKQLIGDMEDMSREHDAGNIDARIDNTRYKGVYKEVSESITDMVDSYVTLIKEISHTLTSFADGNFDISPKSYPGKKAAISNSATALQKNLLSINQEVNSLLQAAAEGYLSNQASISNFRGGWAVILTGLNDLLETLRETIIGSAPLAYAILKEGAMFAKDEYADLIVESNDYAKEVLNMYPGVEVADCFIDKTENNMCREVVKSSGSLSGKLVHMKTKSGGVQRFYLTIKPVNRGTSKTHILWAVNVEDNEKKNDAIKQMQDALQKIIDTLPIAMLICEKKNKTIVYGNISYLKMFELSSLEDVTGKVLELGELTGSSSTWEIRHKLPSGKVLEARVISGEIVYGDELCIVEILQDIGAERSQTLMLLNAAEKEREANQIKSRFLMNVSHEIRTPMNAIIGLSQIALAKRQDRDNYDSYTKINQSAKNLLAIINDILDFSKIEADKIELINDDFCLEETISDAFLVAADIVKNKDIEMLLQMDTSIPYYIRGDKTRLWQVLKNLLDNSAKYTDKGSIYLKVFMMYMGQQDDSKVNLSFIVSDTGMGMTEQQLEKLFLPFEQFHNGRRPGSTGTGLGMPITLQLIKLMGGEVSVESTPDVGTEIRIDIPFDTAKNTSTLNEVINRFDIPQSDVLIVDDEPISCEIIMSLLEGVGITSDFVHNGADALQRVIARRDNPYGTIILDYMLGEEQNGLDLSREIRKYAATSRFLMVTANTSRLPYDEILADGFNAVIDKPFIPTAFIRSMSQTVPFRKMYIKSAPTTFAGAKVLLVEDNEINQEVALGMLGMFDINAMVANNGEECLKLLERESFHLILMDILMPVMDGHKTTVRIRNSGKPYKDIPIIAMTANVMKDEIALCLEEGMNAHIGKPVDQNDLYEQLIKFLPEHTLNRVEITHEQSVAMAIDGINADEGIARFGGKVDRYEKALLKFAKSLEHLPDFSDITNVDNQEKSHRDIHSLKGTSGNLGIVEIFEHVKVFERGLRKGVPDAQLYETLRKSCMKIKAAIMKAFKEQPQDNADKATTKGTPQEFMDIITSLINAVESSEPSACANEIAKLRQKSWDNIDANQLSELDTLIEAYEFDEALAFLHRVLS